MFLHSAIVIQYWVIVRLLQKADYCSKSCDECFFNLNDKIVDHRNLKDWYFHIEKSWLCGIHHRFQKSINGFFFQAGAKSLLLYRWSTPSPNLYFTLREEGIKSSSKFWFLLRPSIFKILTLTPPKTNQGLMCVGTFTIRPEKQRRNR